jgi:5-methylcytosine-specific restriction endonuclease McrA
LRNGGCMRYSSDDLNAIYDRTSGYCHICKRKVAFCNYGALGRRGAWEVEHSHARAKGGSDRLGNLYAACIKCNREKGTT